ncbi:MAG: hypothetical protein VX603_12435 [Gemmatimonadota bacterium]|nr:hypothetical protein [Gemmatimonadota bacterium]
MKRRLIIEIKYVDIVYTDFEQLFDHIKMTMPDGGGDLLLRYGRHVFSFRIDLIPTVIQ